MVWGGFSILALLGLHSLVDFPLRTEALAGVAGVAFGLVFMPANNERPAPRGRGPALVGFTAVAVIAALIGGEVFRIYAAQADVRAGHGAAAVGLDPLNGEGLALAGEERLLARDYANARALASEARETVRRCAELLELWT